MTIAVGAGAAVLGSSSSGFSQGEIGASSCSDCGRRGSEPAGSAETGAGPEAGGEGPEGTTAAPVPEGARPLVEGLRHIPIRDVTGDALDSFYRAVADVESATEGEKPVARVVFIGDSHTAADLMTGQLRRLLQQRFGDAGHGFIAAGRPWRSFRHRDIESGQSGSWDTFRARHPRSRLPEDEDNRLGYGGVAIESERRGSKIWLRTSEEGPVGTKASRFELFYLSQPRGGRMEVSLDGTSVARLSTRVPDWTPGYHLVETEDGPHELSVEVLGRGLVRLYGVAVERDGPGIVLDSLGINGARVMTVLASDHEIVSEHLSRRDPDLVILWYGTNEAGDDWYSPEQYEQWVIDALTLVRRSAPGASCLFMGPPDMGRLSLAEESETLATPPELRRIIRAQRDAADLVGCAHFDTFEAMGGDDTVARWAELEPPLAAGDGIHLTSDGYEVVADLLYNALLDGYERHADRLLSE